jgi:HlyD family secretion protein/macrolide-specific efflux system membrane fusion protein
VSTSAARKRAVARLAAVGVAIAAGVPLALLAGTSAGATTTTITLTAQGTIQAPRQVALAFSGPGQLVEIDVHPGQRVAADQLLARLDPTAALAAVQTARANLASARAQLTQLRQGLSPAERSQLHVGLAQSVQALSSARRSMVDTGAIAATDARRLRTALAQADAQLAADGRTLNRDQASLASQQQTLTSDQSTTDTINTHLVADRAQLAADQQQLLMAQKKQTDDQASGLAPATLAADADTILDDQAAVGSDQSKLADDQSSAADARSAVTTDQSRIENDQQALAADRDRLIADRNAISVARNAQRAGAVSDRQSIDAAVSQVASTRITLAATRAANAAHLQPPRIGAIAAARAAVDVAAAALTTSEQGLRSTRLLAPFAGTIATLNGTVGQLVPGQGPGGLITLVDLDHLTVTAGFSGAQAALLSSGQPATVTVPALDGQALAGHVLSVDPLPDPHTGNYLITIALADPQPTLRPGMAVQVAIRAATTLTASPR